VGDALNSGPSVLEGYIREADLAKQLRRSVRTLQRLTARRLGPPRIKIGRSVYYKIESVRAWLEQQEEQRKRPGSARPPQVRLKRG
jgi:predicted DNA-binding transcriptional regulator AlpA